MGLGCDRRVGQDHQRHQQERWSVLLNHSETLAEPCFRREIPENTRARGETARARWKRRNRSRRRGRLRGRVHRNGANRIEPGSKSRQSRRRSLEELFGGAFLHCLGCCHFIASTVTFAKKSSSIFLVAGSAFSSPISNNFFLAGAKSAFGSDITYCKSPHNFSRSSRVNLLSW